MLENLSSIAAALRADLLAQPSGWTPSARAEAEQALARFEAVAREYVAVASAITSYAARLER